MSKLIRNILQVFINLLHTKLTLIIAFSCGLLVSHLTSRYNSGCVENQKLHDNSYFVVVLVLSAPNNLERRNAIRETWLNLRPRIINNSFYNNEVILLPRKDTDGKIEPESVETQRLLLQKYKQWLQMETKNIKVGDYKVRHYFAIGTKNLDATTRKAVKDEQAVFNDLLLLPDLVDSYENLTNKLLQSFVQVETQLDYNYLLKCDDDTYVKLDILSQDLLDYHQAVEKRVYPHGVDNKDASHNQWGLYWGYFNGRAQIKTAGKWKETSFNLCDRYLPYALGGGYVISRNLVSYLAKHHDTLNTYLSEDITVGTWLAPFKHIHRRHDVRFDTGYKPRICRNYHLVLHKRDPNDMKQIYKNDYCANEDTTSLPKEYFYDWTAAPSKCCDTKA
ncbi:beta-1,3-galactosyltransferase 6 [Culicoides brevitarsis]|uniref:beta-1,3-galactosyltransferase 6 n=1 Tax=Culicoides brevitarsis TaxID=469753 RepID=UPI00307BC7FD